MSPAMTAVYAKVPHPTLRRHWHTALKVNHDGQKAEIAADHLFFFSSRRRHTRCYRDWSSDVCSSDLRRRHTRCYRDWSSDVCSSDLRHTRCYRDWSSDVCSSDLMIRHTRCYRDWRDVCSSD